MTQIQETTLSMLVGNRYKPQDAPAMMRRLTRVASVLGKISAKFGFTQLTDGSWTLSEGYSLLNPNTGLSVTFIVKGSDPRELQQWVAGNVLFDEFVLLPGNRFGLTLHPEGAFPRNRHCVLVEKKERGNLWQLFQWQTTYGVLEMTPPTTIKGLLL